MTGTLKWTPDPNAMAEDVFIGLGTTGPKWSGDTLPKGTAMLKLTGFIEGESFEIYILSYGTAQPDDRIESAHLTGIATVTVKPALVGATGLSIVFSA